MPIEGFDYQLFAKDLSEQAKKFVPSELDDSQAIYVINKVREIMKLYGEKISNEKIVFTNRQAMFISQTMGEWSFHKTIDLIKSEVNLEYINIILQKINDVIYELIKHMMKINIPEEKILNQVENKINEVYKAELYKLKKINVINNVVYNKALKQSSIDDFVEQSQKMEEKV